jgi:uncharacterized protein YbjQ (UPF0145 family)
MAGFKNMVGGEITDYTKLMAESREQALDRLMERLKFWARTQWGPRLPQRA